ncbi:MAG: DNA-3-methyladenine glycosylase I [Thermoleophilia bacterium]
MFQRQPWMQRAGEFPGGDVEYHELLARAVFSGGLGPRVVEARWAGITEAFRGFDPAAVAAMGADDVSRLLADPGVIRNRRKIEAVIENAGRFLDITAEHGGFHEYLCSAGAAPEGGASEGEASDLEAAAAELAGCFRHLGPASAALFLFSAGWRSGPDDEGVDAQEEVQPTGEASPAKPEGVGRASSRRKAQAGTSVAAAV